MLAEGGCPMGAEPVLWTSLITSLLVPRLLANAVDGDGLSVPGKSYIVGLYPVRSNPATVKSHVSRLRPVKLHEALLERFRRLECGRQSAKSW